MICMERWLNMTMIVRKRLIRDGYTFIPANRYKLEEGYYSAIDLLLVLRRRKGEKDVVQFILDRLE